MMGWMDDEALARTLTTGRATYWSRSRQEYWLKGETSGHVQWVKEVRLDCDGDTLLLLVDQEGGACHTGDRTCFDADLFAGARRWLRVRAHLRSPVRAASASPRRRSLPWPATSPGPTPAAPQLRRRARLSAAPRPWGLAAEQMPVAGALALVVLACWGVVLVSRGRVRRAVAVLAALAAAGIVASVVIGFSSVPDALRADLLAAGIEPDRRRAHRLVLGRRRWARAQPVHHGRCRAPGAGLARDGQPLRRTRATAPRHPARSRSTRRSRPVSICGRPSTRVATPRPVRPDRLTPRTGLQHRTSPVTRSPHV